jgi:DNA invertase Pin-like site-specific DNA recombinase
MTKAYSYIRMSTEKQLKGDSLRRQKRDSEEFAQQHGLTLDDTFKLRDIGLSAYDGSNIEKGQLGKFLHAVKSGKIESGSFLIIESLDRLSRQRVRDALRIFLDLLERGINIATLIDKQIYTHDSTDHAELLATLSLMARANDESRTKSHRGRQVWQNKRDTADAKILTKQCPRWLKARPDRKGFDPIPERVKVVRRIFKESAENGADWIARRLTREGVRTFGSSKGGRMSGPPKPWQKSSVLKILKSKAVLGEFQPRSTVGGKRGAAGDVLKGYYPAIIKEDLFYQAQHSLHERLSGAAGRKGEKISNLFSHIARCGVCRGPMWLVNKRPKGGRSLVCSNAKLDAGCHVRVQWKYDDFETSFFAFIREANLPEVMGAIKPDDDRAKLGDEIKATEGRLIEAERRRDRAFELYTDSDQPTDFMRSQFRESEASVEAFKGELDDLKQRLSSLDREETAFNESREGIMDLVARLQKEDGDELVPMRSAVAQRLSDIVAELLVWPGGIPKPSAEHEAQFRQSIQKDDELSSESRVELREYLAKVMEYIGVPEKSRRTFYVRFRDGTSRFVSPTLKNPAQFRYIGATNEPPLTDSDVRDYLRARYEIDNPNPEQYQVAFDEIRREPERFERYSEHISLLRIQRNAGKGASVHSKATTKSE